MATGDKRDPLTDTSPGNTTPRDTVEAATAATPSGTILPPGDHYQTTEFGTSHKTVRTEVGSAYASAAAAYVGQPDRQAAILALEPQYQALSDAVLHVIVEGVEPAGPHVGDPGLPEEMLNALGRFEQGERQKTRDTKETRKTRLWSFIDKAILVFFGAIVGWIIKAMTE